MIDLQARHKDHQVENGEQHALAFVFFAALAIAIEDADKGDGDCAADEEVVHQVGEAECGHICIGLRTGSEDPCDIFATRQTY